MGKAFILMITEDRYYCLMIQFSDYSIKNIKAGDIKTQDSYYQGTMAKNSPAATNFFELERHAEIS